jgi:diaminopimelate epimerase
MPTIDAVRDPVPFLLGHGTANDFVLLPDHDGQRHGPDLDPALVRALCDRRRGLGGDGVIRVVRTAALQSLGSIPESLLPAGAAAPEWFMDYRNADGSVAEMCGNGVRVLALHLAQAGLVPADRPIALGTRGGVASVRVEDDGTLSVDMGAPRPGLTGARVRVKAGSVDADGTAVAMPNPHAVVMLADLDGVGPLLHPPVVGPEGVYPEGTNVEFVTRDGRDRLRMRVWERGVGETPSCGTGVCAAAWVAMTEDRAAPGRPYRVDVPGGALVVTARTDGHLVLRGPAVVLAEGTVDVAALPWRRPISDDAGDADVRPWGR